MLIEFTRVLESIFPNIDRAAIRELHKRMLLEADLPAQFFATQIPLDVNQGDVLGPLRFITRDSDGDLWEDAIPGMLISQSCDWDNDSYGLFAPCYPFARYQKSSQAASIKANEMTGLFYLEPIARQGPLVVDLTVMQRFTRAEVERDLAVGVADRVTSFTPLGYVFFLAKLTMHLMRPPQGEIRGVSKPPALDRLRYMAAQLPAMVRYALLGT